MENEGIIIQRVALPMDENEVVKVSSIVNILAERLYKKDNANNNMCPTNDFYELCEKKRTKEVCVKCYIDWAIKEFERNKK